jgi:hypothetical protein
LGITALDGDELKLGMLSFTGTGTKRAGQLESPIAWAVWKCGFLKGAISTWLFFFYY